MTQGHISRIRLIGLLLIVGAAFAGSPGSVRAAEAAETPPDYRIAAEDVLQVTVWKEEGLDHQVIVRPDGGISFPLAGNVIAAGKTPAEVEAEIAKRLQRYIPDAVVTVSVLQLQGLRVYVTGQVRNPGQFTVGRYVDVLQAITLAGGLTPFANESGIKIIRREDGRERIYKFNYGQVRKGENLGQNIVLQTDDVVVVP
jgi:polysaccharide biosynthesis/export protein